jgi:hypothetical protein
MFFLPLWDDTRKKCEQRSHEFFLNPSQITARLKYGFRCSSLFVKQRRKEKMEFSTIDKTKITAAIAIILLMSSAILMVIPAIAQEDGDHGGAPQITGMEGSVVGAAPSGANITYYFDPLPRLAFTPNPIGVDQVFTVNIWVTPPPAANRFMKDYQVKITKPDGSTNTVTINSYVADGTSWFPYLADQVGDWKLQFFFQGQYNPPGWYSDGEYDGETPYAFSRPGWQWYDGDYYSPANTPEQILTVQQDFVYSWPLISLPTDYWTRPISLEHREWAQIAGNYPWDQMQDTIGEYNGAPDYYGPYATAPNTSHVAWKKMQDTAGIIGGEAGVYGDLGTSSTPSVIYMGRCYQTYTKPGVGSVAGCYDLRTGEIYYEIPTSEGGVTPRWIAYEKPTDTSVPGAGAARAITATLIAVDSTSNPEELYKINPFSGSVSSYDLTNDQGDGPGRILAFRENWFLSVRDSSDAVVDPYMVSHFWNRTSIQDNGYPTYLVNWTVIPNTNTFANRMLSNHTYRLCPSYRGSADNQNSRWNWYGRFGAADLDSGYTVVARRFFQNGVWGGMAVGTNIMTGEVAWELTFDDIAPYSPRTTLQEDGVYVICFNQGQVWGIDVTNGNIKWKYTENSYPFGGFWGYDEAAAYGLAYFWSYDGVQAYNIEEGGLEWHYDDVAVPFETTYIGRGGEEAYSFNGNGVVVDGKVYTRNSEHTATAPYTRGWSLHCLDAMTGDLIWKIGNPMTPGAAADGYLTAGNSYDGYLYVFGKGESETTVSAPGTEVPLGSAVMITGSVLDMSPAQPGTPCVSVGSMDTQMNYIHLQHPIDGLFNNETISGVDVALVAIGSDGSYEDLGTTTTDGYYGTFGFKWTPTAQVNYEIVASFEGSDAYGSSSASTYLTVGPAPAAEVTPEPTTEEPVHPMFSTEALIVIGVIAIVAIAIIAYLVMRKPKQ